MREHRLGDDIDDFCVRCKRVMNHSVVSVVAALPAKVRCRTCHSDHDYRHEQAPPPKVDLRKQALFNEVLKKVDPSAEAVEGAGAADGVPDVSAILDGIAEPEPAAPEAAMEAEAGAGAEAPVAAAPKPKAKSKAKARK